MAQDLFEQRAKKLGSQQVGTQPKEDPFITRATQINQQAEVKAPEERGFMPSLGRGWGAGVTGLLTGGQPQPAPQDESWLEHIGSLVGETASDLPGMLTSGLAGEAVAGPIGGVAGAFAGPTLLKKSLEEYRDYAAKGNNITFGDFLERAGRVSSETGKSAAIGAATGAISKVLPFLKNVPGIDKLLKTKYGTTAATGALELGAMTGSKAALERRLPDKREVVDNALMLLGSKVAAKGGDVIARAIPESVLEKGRSLSGKIFEKSANKKQFFDMLQEHVGNRNAKLMESQLKWREELENLEKTGKLSKQDLKDMMYYRQKTGDPKIKGDTFEALDKRLNPRAKNFVDNTIDKHFKESLKAWNDNPVTKDIKPREGLEDVYLPGLYKNEPKEFKRVYDEVSKRFKTKNPFSNEKVFMNYLEAFQKAGLEPRYNNMFDLMKAYDSIMVKSTANSELVQRIKDIEKKAGEKFIVRSTEKKQYEDAKANGFIQFDDPYLRRYVAGTKEGKGRGPEPIWATTTGPVLVHPDFASVFQGIFTKEAYRNPSKALKWWDSAGDLLRTVHVKLSPFHYAALAEHGASTIGTRKSLGYLLNRWSKDIDALRKNKEFMTDAVRSGLTVHAHAPVEGLKKGGYIFNEYHPRLKVASWKNFTDSEISRRATEGKPATAEEIVNIKRDMASLTNNIFGGQNWELQPILNNPKYLKTTRRLIAYPDWTVSAIKNAANIFAPGVKGTVARKTWIRYGINYMMLQGAMKFLMSGWQNKDKDPKSGIEFNPKKALEGLDSAKNDPSAWYKFPLPDINVNIAGHIFNPGRNADNKKLYAHTGKQAIEIQRWIKDFTNEAFSKSNPLIQMIYKQVMGSTPYEGGTMPVRGKYEAGQFKPWDASKPGTLDRFVSRAKELATSVAPFGIQRIIKEGPTKGIAPWIATGGGALPISGGMSLMKSEGYLEKAIRSGNNKQVDQIRHVLLNNGYSEKQIKARITKVRNSITK